MAEEAERLEQTKIGEVARETLKCARYRILAQHASINTTQQLLGSSCSAASTYGEE